MEEFFVVQNYALGSLSIYHFAKSYYETKDKLEGPIIPLTMLVLPIVFNERCLTSISEVKKVSGRVSMLNVLAEHRDLPVGMQKRVVEMREQSLRSLNLGFAKGLLGYNKENSTIFPMSRLKLASSNVNDNQRIFHSSKILGKWFAFNTIEQICIALNISFNTDEF